MATYADAIRWIADNDGAGDTPTSMSWEEAHEIVYGQVTVCLVADVFQKDQHVIASDVLRQRGLRAPRAPKRRAL